MPNKWWQWVLVYPTLVISFFSAIPTFRTLYSSYAIGVPYANVAKAEEQRKLWVRNIDCVKEEKSVVMATTKTNDIVKVAACEDTGDIIVEVNHADGRKIAKWVSFQNLCEPCVAELVGNAYAMEPQGQVYIEVICQRWADSVHLYRRVKVGNRCFDEMVNTYTGEIVMRSEVPCIPCSN